MFNNILGAILVKPEEKGISLLKLCSPHYFSFLCNITARFGSLWRKSKVWNPLFELESVFRTLSNIYYQKQPPQVFCKKRCPQKFRKIHRKTPVPEKQRLWHRCFPVNFAKFPRTPLLQNTSGRLICVIEIFLSVLSQMFGSVINTPLYLKQILICI